MLCFQLTDVLETQHCLDMRAPIHAGFARGGDGGRAGRLDSVARRQLHPPPRRSRPHTPANAEISPASLLRARRVYIYHTS